MAPSHQAATRDPQPILVIAGPKARDVLVSARRRPTVAERVPWLRCGRFCYCTAEAVAMSVSFLGELAWEIHVPLENAVEVPRLLIDAGAAFAFLRSGSTRRSPCGSRRLRTGNDLINEFDPSRAVGRFNDLNKFSFPGRDALIAKAILRPAASSSP
jgi:dimethylglycine dehydrogenase